MSQYIENARREIAKAEARAGKYKGACSDCRWSQHGRITYVCGPPAVELAAFNTDPSSAKYIIECEEQRSKESIWGAIVCGPDGELFEQKLGFLERLFGA